MDGRVQVYTNQVADQAGAYPGFCNMKQLKYFYFWMDGRVHAPNK